MLPWISAASMEMFFVELFTGISWRKWPLSETRTSVSLILTNRRLLSSLIIPSTTVFLTFGLIATWKPRVTPGRRRTISGGALSWSRSMATCLETILPEVLTAITRNRFSPGLSVTGWRNRPSRSWPTFSPLMRTSEIPFGSLARPSMVNFFFLDTGLKPRVGGGFRITISGPLSCLGGATAAVFCEDVWTVSISGVTTAFATTLGLRAGFGETDFL